MELNERKPILNGRTPTHSSEDVAAEKRKFSFRELSARKKSAMVLLALGNFVLFCCFSMIAPMYPPQAKAKEMPPVLIGLVFSCFELWVTVMSPVFGKFMTKIGAKFLLISGLFLAGVCIILFGILDKSPPGVTFAVLSFTVRSFEAVGASAYYTSSFTILANELPDHVTTVFGYLEMFYGAGAMAGPVIGGFLYELGGYGLPFWVVGSLLLSCTAIMAVLLPNPTAIARKQEGSMLRLLSSPRVVISVISVAFGGYVFGFINATLALHLEKFHLRVFYVGLLFVMLGGLYAIMTLFYGWISDRNGVETARVVMAAGNIVLGVAFLLSGPAPFLSFLGSGLWLIILSQVLVGLVLGAVLISPITFAYSGASRLGFERCMELDGQISGLVSGFLHFGVFLGPVVGSTVVQYAGFQWSSTVTAFLAFFVASCIGLNALQEKMCPKSDDTGKNAEMIICDDVKSANHHIPRDNLSSQ